MLGALASIAAPVIGGLMGGGGGSEGGGGTTVTQNIPWEGVQPYMIGDANTSMGQKQPLNSDWLYWNYMSQQGAPIGPAPPMYVNDQRYTGENVFDPAFQYQQARTGGPAYGQEGQFGAPTPSGGGLFGGADPSKDYPSSGENDVLVGTPDEEEEEEEEEAGLSDLDIYILRQRQRGNDMAVASAGPDGGSFGANQGAPRLDDLSKEGQEYARERIESDDPAVRKKWRDFLTSLGKNKGYA